MQPTGPRASFISHARADNALCQPYFTGLKARGLDVWFDLNDNPEGHMLAAELQRQLQARPALVVLVTPAALASFWVNLEVEAYLGLMAQDRSRMLLPVRIATCDMPPFMNAVTWIDGVGVSVTEAVERIARALSGTGGQGAVAQALPAMPAFPQRELFDRLSREAHEELLASRWNDATAKARFALGLNGATPTVDLLGDLALASAGAGRWPDCLDAAQRAIDLDIGRPEMWQTKARALTALAAAQRATGKDSEARASETGALDALDSARALILSADLPARLALLAERRAALTGAQRWAEALETVDDELALAPGAPTRLAARLDLLQRLSRQTDALAVARQLAARPDAAASDHLTFARLLKATGAPEAPIRAALDTAARLLPDAAHDATLAAARRDLLSPPPPAIPPDRFPPRLANLSYTAQIRDGVEVILPPLCSIPAGPFRLGSDKKRDKDAGDDELKRLLVDLPGYQIARFPVTVAEYACFLRDHTSAPKHAEPTSRHNAITWQAQLGKLDHPVINVSWYDAYDYTQWLKRVTGGQPWRLASEAEWEKAARLDPRDPLGASSERIYPWGDTDDTARRNGRSSGLIGTSPVGWYNGADENARAGRKSGASPCGVEEMAGNVWEWTASLSATDYIQAALFTPRESSDRRSLRGGSWSGNPSNLRAAYRCVDDPVSSLYSIGFRVVLVAPDSPRMLRWPVNAGRLARGSRRGACV